MTNGQRLASIARHQPFLTPTERQMFLPSLAEQRATARTLELAPRTSRDVCRDACAVERPTPKAGGHRWIVPACIACLVALPFVLKSAA